MIGAGLLGLFAVDLTTERLSANVKVASGLFLILSLCSTVIFSFFDFRVPSYIITNGLFALGYALVLNIIIGEPG